MKIVVIGGSGLIGENLVRILREAGHAVVNGSPTHGVDAVTGEGLANALQGTDVVVNVSNAPSLDEAAAIRFFEASGRQLAAATKAAGVHHNIVLSIVGTDGLQSSGYFRGKAIQEELVRAAGVPFSILRATQFFEWIAGVVQNGEAEVVVLAPALVQPMSASCVAGALANLATSRPLNGAVEVAGPEQFRLPDLAREVLTAYEDPRQVVADPHALYFGAELSEHSLLPGRDARRGERRFEDWLRETLRGLPDDPEPDKAGDSAAP